MAPVKNVNFEDYPSIATRGTARSFITVQANCTLYVADYNYNYSVYNECTSNENEYSGTIVQRQPICSRLVTQLFKWQTFILILKNSHTKFSVISRTMTGVNNLENPSNESRHPAKKVHVFQVKCLSLLTDRRQTYVCCTKWQCRACSAVSEKIALTETEIHLTKDFDLQELNLWLLTEGQIARSRVSMPFHIYI